MQILNEWNKMRKNERYDMHVHINVNVSVNVKHKRKPKRKHKSDANPKCVEKDAKQKDNTET